MSEKRHKQQAQWPKAPQNIPCRLDHYQGLKSILAAAHAPMAHHALSCCFGSTRGRCPSLGSARAEVCPSHSARTSGLHFPSWSLVHVRSCFVRCSG